MYLRIRTNQHKYSSFREQRKSISTFKIHSVKGRKKLNIPLKIDTTQRCFFLKKHTDVQQGDILRIFFETWTVLDNIES